MAAEAPVLFSPENQEETSTSDPQAENYGDIPLVDLQSKPPSGRVWTLVGSLDDSLAGKTVLVRGRLHKVRAVTKKTAFVVVREECCTVQCLVVLEPEKVSPQMMKFVTGLSNESIVDVEGEVSVPDKPLKGTSQQVEIHVRKIYCIDRAASTLPFTIEDASRSEAEIDKAAEHGKTLARVNQDTRLNNRVLDLRTPANYGIFLIKNKVKEIFAKFLRSERFVEVETPKLLAGSSEGGSEVFKLTYKGGRPACLAQSPQLHKQMSIASGHPRVLVIGGVYRAEDSYTHRHLCEFTGLDVEMEIKEHYSEVMDVVDKLFVAIFDGLNEGCQEELEAIGKQYPFKPLKYLRKTLRLTFEEGIQMLQDAKVKIDHMGDLNTAAEKKLGQLVLDKYDTEFFILHRYPLAVRPFYTMPCHDSPDYSNSFDVFLRGEEIISGAQRVHRADLLIARAEACGIDVSTISTYIDSFRLGMPLHGGFGAGLERIVMLFCALDNIRKTSMFPRDPKRLTP